LSEEVFSLKKILIAVIISVCLMIVNVYEYGHGSPLSDNIVKAKSKSEKIAIFMKFAAVYEESGAFSEALDAYQKALEISSKNSDIYTIYCHIGAVRASQKDYLSAINAYQSAAKLGERDELALLKLADAYAQGDLYVLSERAYNEVLKINKKSYQANVGLADLYALQDLNLKAMKYYFEALLQNPEVQIYRKIAKCAENEKDYELGIRMLNNIASEHLTWDDYMLFGKFYIGMQDYQKAQKVFLKACEINPSNSDGYMYLGLAYLYSDQFDQSKKFFKIANEKSKNNAAGHFMLAQMFFKEKDFEKAKKHIYAARSLAKTPLLKYYADKLLNIL
jgi:tetratricopeptide (TPR) repeat protein